MQLCSNWYFICLEISIIDPSGNADCIVQSYNSTQLTCVTGSSPFGTFNIRLYVLDTGYAVGDFNFTYLFGMYLIAFSVVI